MKEVWWVSISDRRKIQNLVTVFKAKNGLLPQYLENIFPSLVSETINLYLLLLNYGMH
jgi:hypothetical protein